MKIEDTFKLLNTSKDLFENNKICTYKIVKKSGTKLKLICIETEQELFCTIDWLNNNKI